MQKKNDPYFRTLAEPLQWSGTELHHHIRSKNISCKEVMQVTLQQIERCNPHLNAIVHAIDPDDALAQAQSKDDEIAAGADIGWLHGFPMAPKDLLSVAGMTTTMGSPIFRQQKTSKDALSAARMRAAGAIFIGRTNVPEFGLGSHTYNPIFGATGNPYQLQLTSGGSSGGAAAALACHLLPVVDGSDFGGSLRNPAAFCNVYGFRPSFGRIPSLPNLDVFTRQFATDGPMARTMTDLSALFDILSGPDRRFPLSAPAPEQSFQAQLTQPFPRPARLAWLGDWGGYLPFEEGILPLCEKALQTFVDMGHPVEHFTPTFSGARLWKIWLTIRHAYAGGAIRQLYQQPEKRALLKPEAQWEVEGLLPLTAVDLLSAQEERTIWLHTLLEWFETYDFLCIPSAQVFAFDKTQDWPKQIAGHTMDTYHRWMEVVTPWTLAGCPVLSVPVGFQGQQAMGMQIIGAPGTDAEVLRMGYQLEQAFSYDSALLDTRLSTP